MTGRTRIGYQLPRSGLDIDCTGARASHFHSCRGKTHAGADHVVVQVAVGAPTDDPLPDLRALAAALDL